jgi:hypothetical protein
MNPILWSLMEGKQMAEDSRFVLLMLAVVVWVLYLALRKGPERRIPLPSYEEEVQIQTIHEMHS